MQSQMTYSYLGHPMYFYHFSSSKRFGGGDDIVRFTPFELSSDNSFFYAKNHMDGDYRRWSLQGEPLFGSFESVSSLASVITGEYSTS